MPTEEEILEQVQGLRVEVGTDKGLVDSALEQVKAATSLAARKSKEAASSAGSAGEAAGAAATARTAAEEARDVVVSLFAGVSWSVPPEWVFGRTYPEARGVTHEGSSWLALEENVDVEPGTDDAEGIWFKLAGVTPEVLAAKIAAEDAAASAAADRVITSTNAGIASQAASDAEENAGVTTADRAVVVSAKETVVTTASDVAAKAVIATSAATAAELAAAAAAASGTLYATTAAGLADTVEDDFFLVAGTGATYALLYRHDVVETVPTATLQTSYPSKAAFDAAVQQVNDRATPAVLVHLPDDLFSPVAVVVHFDDAGRIIGQSAAAEPVEDLQTRTADLEDAKGTILYGEADDVAAEWYDGEGRLVARAATVEAVRQVADDLDAGLADAKVTTTVQVFLPDTYPEVCYFDDDGRWIPNVGASGGTSLLKLTHTADVGADYRTEPTISVPDADVDNGVALFGQSYAKAASDGAPYSSTARNPGYALMPSVGVFPDGAPYTAYADLRSITVVAEGDEAVNETMAPEMAFKILAEMQARLGLQRRHVFHISARGGQQYRAIARGTAIWNELLRQVEANTAISRALGRRYVQRCVVLCHGEADHAMQAWEYKIAELQMQAHLEADIKARTGQTEPLKFISYAPTRNTISGSVRLNGPTTAMRQLMVEQPHLFTMAGPAYGIRHSEDAHPTMEGYRCFGHLMGVAYLYHVLGTGFRPCDVNRWYWTSATTVRVEVFVPFGGALVDDRSGDLVGYPTDPADPTYIGPPPSGQESTGRDGGWRVRDKDGAFGVVSAAVSGNNIDITLSRAGAVGSTVLLYAARPQGATISGDNTNMARGTFRGDTAMTIPDSAETIYPWLIPVELTL